MKFAAKKLTRSDLTFFEHQFRLQNAGNQKSINLNANIFVNIAFPLARSTAGGHPKKFPMPLAIYGPGLRALPHTMTRKVIAAGGSQKNWRLNGEFVADPDFDPERYHNLQADDLVVFGMEEEAGLPTAMTLVLISQAEHEDHTVMEMLLEILNRKSMSMITEQELLLISDKSPENHPIRELLDTEMDEALEDAAQGSADGVKRLLRRRSPRRMSAEALKAAQERAQTIGREGEVLIDELLTGMHDKGEIRQSTWVAEDNAINPWDFELVDNDGTVVRIEVKSTNGPFTRKMHISHAEVEAAADLLAPRTDLYRVFEISDGSAWLQVAHDIREFAEKISAAAQTMGEGVLPDGYTIAPNALAGWTDPVHLAFDDQDQD